MSLSDDRKARAARVDQIEQELIAAKRAADAQEPRVNSLWAWLTARRVINGIGRDFEWTLIPRGR
jgi:hypothetical protein